MFEWDKIKNQKNFEKHGITFEVAVEVFTDKDGYEVPRIVDNEIRIKYVGSLDDVILSVIYTKRGKKYRIISARCASKIERRLYHENKK